MEESTGTQASEPRAAGEAGTEHPPETGGAPPEVRTVLADGVAAVTLTGELTEEARKPLVRTMTDLLLGEASLRAVRLQLRDVSFMNSAGMAVLVQLQRMAAPRGVEVVLVQPPTAVARPLQLTGLWRRFPIVEDGTS
jgi:stage II sporulation protein AA (anti-sigma F factor antagonist)